MIDPLIIFGCCLILGAVIGIFAGLLGIGGGLLMVPACLYLFDAMLNLPSSQLMPMAIATSLASIIMTSAASARAHYRKGNLGSDHLTPLTLGVIVGAVIGACTVTLVAGEKLQIIFGVLTCFVALQMAYYRDKIYQNVVTTPRLMAIGTVVGSLASLLGVGGGAFMVPALTWLNINIKQAIARASFCGSVIAIVATFVFMTNGDELSVQPQFSIGYVYLPATLGVILTSWITARIGAAWVVRLPISTLKRVFAIFLLCVGINMLSPLFN